jgi:DNA-directed RNA polymerase subunit beta
VATYRKSNEYGFIESPYRKVVKELDAEDKKLIGRLAGDTIKDEEGKTVVKAGTAISSKAFARFSKLNLGKVKVRPFVTDDVVYLSADKEDVFTVAQANSKLDAQFQFLEETVEARQSDHYLFVSPDQVDLMDVSPKQIVSVATALIPFLEHDDANRALMGANMQRQAVPLVRAEAPLVATGMEAEAARHSGQLLFARNAGVVKSVTGNKVVITEENGEDRVYDLMKFVRTNQGTCITQKPIVNKGDKMEAGGIIADSSAIERGELALGECPNTRRSRLQHVRTTERGGQGLALRFYQL